VSWFLQLAFVWNRKIPKQLQQYTIAMTDTSRTFIKALFCFLLFIHANEWSKISEGEKNCDSPMWYNHCKHFQMLPENKDLSQMCSTLSVKSVMALLAGRFFCFQTEVNVLPVNNLWNSPQTHLFSSRTNDSACPARPSPRLAPLWQCKKIHLRWPRGAFWRTNCTNPHHLQYAA